jgi:hypothetical protein
VRFSDYDCSYQQSWLLSFIHRYTDALKSNLYATVFFVAIGAIAGEL